MISPAAGAWRLICAFLLGIILGIGNEFLRPLRKKHLITADLLLCLTMLVLWIELACGVCGADPRAWDTGVFFLGAAVGAFPLGKLLRPVFRWFWGSIRRIISLVLYPFRKFSKILRKFSKFLYATGKKWGTISRKDRQGGTKSGGGVPNVQS